jgi:Lrp/AsnC family leucine-responsive transcriptional regulator
VQTLALDPIDLRLLAALQEHGRASNLELAAAVKLSPAQTLRRHRRLEELGIIKRYETRLDAQALGFGVVAFIQVTMERGHMRELVKFKELIATLPQVQECYSVTEGGGARSQGAIRIPARHAHARAWRQQRAFDCVPR